MSPWLSPGWVLPVQANTVNVSLALTTGETYEPVREPEAREPPHRTIGHQKILQTREPASSGERLSLQHLPEGKPLESTHPQKIPVGVGPSIGLRRIMMSFSRGIVRVHPLRRAFQYM